MTDSGQPPNASFEAEDELDYLFANASPNPNREGCPSRDELVRVSRLEKPIGNAAYTHIVSCSPCFREMRALQQTRARWQRARMWIAGAAAVLALTVGASWWMARSPADAALVATTIDLRPFAVMRGDTQPSVPIPVTLARARLDATIVLPLGAETGTYEIQLRDETLAVRAAASSRAQIDGSLTTLRASLDTAALPSGEYRLALRRADGEWQVFAARLQ